MKRRGGRGGGGGEGGGGEDLIVLDTVPMEEYSRHLLASVHAIRTSSIAAEYGEAV